MQIAVPSRPVAKVTKTVILGSVVVGDMVVSCKGFAKRWVAFVFVFCLLSLSCVRGLSVLFGVFGVKYVVRYWKNSTLLRLIQA